MEFPFKEVDIILWDGMVDGAPNKFKLCLKKGNLENQLWKSFHGKKQNKILIKGDLIHSHKKIGSKGL